MRGTVAKRLRREVYGKGHHPGVTRYGMVTDGSLTIVGDVMRRRYQDRKRDYKNTIQSQ